MKKKTARVSKETRNKSELVMVVLAGAAVLMAFAVALLWQQNSTLSDQNYTLEQQYIQQNSQIQSIQDKMKMMQVKVTPTPAY